MEPKEYLKFLNKFKSKKTTDDCYKPGKVDMQAWRSMTNAMGGQLNQLAESMLGTGKNGMDLYNAMKDGSITFADFNDALLKLDKDGFGKYASFAEQAKSATEGLQTGMANLRTAMVRGLANGLESINKALKKSKLPTIGKVLDMVREKVNNVRDENKTYDKIKR